MGRLRYGKHPNVRVLALPSRAQEFQAKHLCYSPLRRIIIQLLDGPVVRGGRYMRLSLL